MTLNLDALNLAKGSHDDLTEGLCLLEASAIFAGESLTDTPACVSPVLGAYGRNLNDALDDVKRQQLKPYIPLLPGTVGDGMDERRGYMALDWLVRTYLPTWLRLVPALTAQADLLAQHAPITDLETAAHIGDIVREAASQASAARDAARAAARAAAGDAAGDAARAAAGDAAWAAAWAAARAAAWAAAGDAAGDAAWDAARDAARAAAWDALAPTVDALQDSAIALYGHMISPVSA